MILYINIKMDLISVIIPYYKKSKYINKTIRSVLNQSHKKIEIIIVYDDTDKFELKILEKLKLTDKRISVIINSKNFGAGISRNIGIKKSKGKFIAFIDADDLWQKNKIKDQLKFMKLNKIKVSHTSYKIFNERKNKMIIKKARNFQHVNELLPSCDIGLSTVMIDRNVFNQNCRFVNLKTKEDFVFWLRILNKYKIFALNKCLTTWRKLDNSLSSSIIQKLVDGFRVYNIYMNFNYIKSLKYLLILSLNYIRK